MITKPAGLGQATILPDIDFETYSEAGFRWHEQSKRFISPINSSKRGLSAVGLQCYAEHPTTEILSLSYNLKDGRGARLWRPGDLPPSDLITYVCSGGLIEAWNVAFEYMIWNFVAHVRHGWPKLSINSVRCAAAKSRAYALPGSLESAGEVMHIANKKDKDGKRLLTKFSIPRNPTKTDNRTRIHPADDPADAERLYQYNIRDIAAEAELSQITPDLNTFEQTFWTIDFLINRRGVRIDIAAVDAALSIVSQAQEKYNAELVKLTDGAITSANQVGKLCQFLGVDSLSSDSIDELLTKPITPISYQILKIRQAIGGSAVKKLYAMKNLLSNEGRIHDMFIYHTARTGRAGGSGIQPQNFPNSGLALLRCDNCGRFGSRTDCVWCGKEVTSVSHEWNAQIADEVIGVVKSGSLDLLEYMYSDAFGAISSCLRGMIISSEKHDFICSDYSAIEAVVLACLAGEQWRIDVFKSHGKIYEMSASKIFSIPFNEFEQHKKTTGQHHPYRKRGKVAELASGYGGGLGAWKKFKADEFLSDEEIKFAVNAWRQSSPAIVKFWGGQKLHGRQVFYGLEGMAIQAILNPGLEFDVRGITFKCKNNKLFCRLPSGRYLTYHRVKIRQLEGDQAWKGLIVWFEGWNNNPMKGRVNAWVPMSTYGGSLCENVVQAVARDILAHAIVNLEKAGYKIVLHVHDEIVAEVPEGTGSIEEFESIMSSMPPWAADWPIRASGGWRGKRYSK